MNTELIPQAPQNTALNKIAMPTDIAGIEKLAAMVCKTDLVPKAYKGKPDETFAAMLFGSQFNLNPLLCLAGIANINGNPQLFGKTALAVIQAHPDFEDLITHKNTVDQATIEMRRKNRTPVTCSFTRAEAELAGLVGRETYKKFLADMLWWRAAHRCIRSLFPDIAQGIAPMSDGELKERHVSGELISTSYDGPPPNLSDATVPGTTPTVEDMLEAIGDCQRLTDLDAEELLANLGSFAGADKKSLGQAWKQRRAEIKDRQGTPQDYPEFPPAALADLWTELTDIKKEHGLEAALSAVDTLEEQGPNKVNSIDKELLKAQLNKS